MFTKRHYNAIATLIRDNRSAHAPDLINAQAFIHGLSDLFKQDNPNFDRYRFLNACDPPDAPDLNATGFAKKR